MARFVFSRSRWRIASVAVLMIAITACGIATSSGATPTAQSSDQATSVRPVPATLQSTHEVTRGLSPTMTLATTMASPALPASCSDPNDEAESAITVGALLPLSEPGNLLAGFAMQTALNIAVRQINEVGGVLGRPLRLITYDTAGRRRQAARYATQLVTSDCAIALIGGFHSNEAEAVSEVAHDVGSPFLIVGAIADSLTESQLPEVFRLSPNSSQIISALPQWLSAVGDYNRDGHMFAVQLVDTRRANSEYMNRYTDAFHAMSIRVETLAIDLPATDFSSVIARIVAFDALPDALLIHIGSEHAFALQSQLLQAGIGPQKSTLILNHNSALNDTLFWSSVPGGIGTLVLRLGPWPNTVGEQGSLFANLYGSYHATWPEYHAFAAFDAMYLVADAMERSKSLQGPDLISALEAADLVLAAGHYDFSFTSERPPAEENSFMWHQIATPQVLILQYSQDNQSSASMPVVWPSTYQTVPTPYVPLGQ